MQESGMLPQYTLALGPDKLKTILEDVFNQGRKEPLAAYYVLYQIGEQKSLIKCDFSQSPFTFWHYNLSGRGTTTQTIKNALTSLVSEKNGANAPFEFVDVSLQERYRALGGRSFLDINSGVYIPVNHTLEHAFSVLEQQKRVQAQAGETKRLRR